MDKYTAASGAVNGSGATSPEKSLRRFLEPQENGRAEVFPLYNNGENGHNLSVSEPSNIGLDTFHLTFSTTFAKIAPRFDAIVSNIANSDGTFEKDPCILWTDTSGQPVYGGKAFFNTENYTFTLWPNGGYPNVKIVASARAFAESNVDLMDEAAARYTIARIQADLEERGLKCSLLHESHFCRLDVSRNLDLEHGCPAYIGMLRTSGSHARRKFLPVVYGDSTIDFRIESLQVSLYDKGKEQEKKASKTCRIIPASKIMRGEVRFLTTEEISRHFGVDKLRPAALLQSGQFSEMQEKYRQVMENTLFEAEKPPQEAILMSNETASQWDEIQCRVAQLAPVGSREYNRLLCYAMNVGAYGIDGARRWYVENVQQGDTEAEKRKRRRFEAELKRVASIFGAVVEESSGLMPDELYNELREKVLSR